VPLLLVHLPHLLLALLAIALVERIELAGRQVPRPSPIGVAVAAGLIGVTGWLALPALSGDHPPRSACLAYLAAALVCAGRSGTLASTRLPRRARARLGRGGRALLGIGVGLTAGGGYVLAGVIMTHGHLLAHAALA
jgi:hypothetical protein